VKLVFHAENVLFCRCQDKDGVYGIDPACVDGDMLRQVEMANDNPTKRLATIEEAARVPRSLIGYQVRAMSRCTSTLCSILLLTRTVTFFLACAD
jgi:hypothetical protein